MKKPAKNILYLFLGDIFTRLIGFFVVTYLAKTLGASGFGKINISLALLSYAMLFSSSGLPILATREVSAGIKNSDKFVGDIISARFLSSLVIFMIFYFLSELLYDDDIARLNSIYLLFLFPFSFLLDWFFQAKKKMDIIAFSKLSGVIIYLIVVFIYVRESNDYNNAAVAWVVNSFVMSTVIMIFFFYKKYRFRITINKNIFKLIVKAFPLSGSSILSQIVMQSPALILSWLATTDDVGIFNIAFRVITLALIIDRIFYMMYFPIVSKEFATRPDAIDKFFKRFLKTITFTALIFGTLIFIFSEQIVLLLFSNIYVKSISVLKILTIYFMFTLINSVFTYTLIAMDREKEFLKSLFMGSLVYFILVFPIFSFFKLEGVALSIVIYEIVVVIYLVAIMRAFGKIAYSRTLLLPVLLTLTFMVFATISQINVLLLSLIFLIIFIPLLYTSIGLKRDDLIYFKKALI